MQAHPPPLLPGPVPQVSRFSSQATARGLLEPHCCQKATPRAQPPPAPPGTPRSSSPLRGLALLPPMAPATKSMDNVGGEGPGSACLKASVPPLGWPRQQQVHASRTLNTCGGGQGMGNRSLLTSGPEGRGHAGKQAGQCPQPGPRRLDSPTPSPQRTLVPVPSGPRCREVCERPQKVADDGAGLQAMSKYILGRSTDGAVMSLSLQVQAQGFSESLDLPSSPGITPAWGTLRAPSLVQPTNTL